MDPPAVDRLATRLRARSFAGKTKTVVDPDYELFAMIVRSGSLSAAGRALSISPAMVSKRLARLEARLGVRLVHRTTRRLTLTDPGTRFHTDVVAILDAIADAERRVAGSGAEPVGRLRISAPTSFGRLHVVPRLHAFLADHPRIELEVDLSDDYVDLFAGRTDVAIRIAADMPVSLHAHRLSDSRRILCASPDYIARHGTPDDIAALAAHRLLAASGQLPWRLARGGDRRTVDGRSHVPTNSSEVVRELAITGVGIALRSLWDIDDALVAGTLVRILPDWEAPRDLGIYAVHPRMPTPAPAIAAFVAFLRDSLDPAPWERRS